MKKLLFLFFILVPQLCFAAMSASIIWEFRSTATANMVNGGGFKTGASGTDYSQQDAAQLTGTDITCTAASTTVTSATGGFTAAMVGNVIHFTALTGTGAIVGWYEITAYTDTNNIVLDRTPTDGANNITAGTFYVGGSLNVGGSLEDDFLEQTVAGQIVYFYGAVTYTPSEAISVLTDGTTTLPITVEGYNTTRGDDPTGTSRPTIAMGANATASGDYFVWKNFIMTGTGTGVLGSGSFSRLINIKATNSTVTANRPAITLNTAGTAFNCEGISTNGNGVYIGSTTRVIGGYYHDSVTGIYINGDGAVIINNIIESNSTNGITYATGMDYSLVYGNTIYGAETPTGTGINIGGGIFHYILNNIIYGFVTGVSQTVDDDIISLDYNDYFNNTTNRSNVNTGDNDQALDPTFTNAVNGDFSIGTNLKALGFPGAFPAGLSTGYLDIGAVQRQEPAGGSVTVGYGCGD